MANFLILPPTNKWCPILPPNDVQCTGIDKRSMLQLADPLFWKSGATTIIVGIEIWSQIVREPIIRIGENLICQNTKFGSVVMGQGGNEENVQILQLNAVQIETDESLQMLLERFWQFEDLNICSKKDAEHEMCEAIFKDKHYRDENGRFVVTIPLKPNIGDIGSSRQIAMKRFLILEKRFQRDKDFRDQYIKFMREFEKLKHITLVPYNGGSTDKPIYHIPHHGIKSEDKFRVVLDASCKTNKNISLNDMQLVGEKLQKDLTEILMSFRLHPVALCADVSKMYRQVKIRTDRICGTLYNWSKDIHAIALDAKDYLGCCIDHSFIGALEKSMVKY